MPRTITTTVYTINELSEKAKEKARQWFQEGQDYLVEHIGEAIRHVLENGGCTITKHGINHRQDLFWNIDNQGAFISFKGWFTHNEINYKVCEFGMKSCQLERNEDTTDEDIAVAMGVFAGVLDAAISAGKMEEEYQTSAENIDELLMANEYTFDEDGKRFG